MYGPLKLFYLWLLHSKPTRAATLNRADGNNISHKTHKKYIAFSLAAL